MLPAFRGGRGRNVMKIGETTKPVYHEIWE